ncbi:transcriptional regulator [Mycobacterium tuberculosis]|nr:transcriptional regulator [Mycobacterium tuberculosis]COW67165.1 transcriptional regulator [Mycobacterium tuberculosis]COX22149.1 transcriptional regulator [Mycobacterium tuberculosis]
MHVLTSPSEDAREMRQNSPFAGILPEATRVAVLRSFKDHWDREHERAMTE